jgi:hypothetical protein
MGTLHEDQYTFLIISCSSLRMRNVSEKKVVKKIKTCIYVFGGSHPVVYAK